MKILFAASEAVPFCKTGGLADVAGALPVRLAHAGHSVALILPLYRAVDRSRHKLVRTIHRITVPFGDKRVHADIWQAPSQKNLKIFFIAAESYFGRPGLYGPMPGTDHSDNNERYAFFSRAVLESSKVLKFKPDIVHAHDWQTGLISALLKSTYKSDPFFKTTGSVFSIHNMAYQGIFGKESMAVTGLPSSEFTPGGIEYYGKVNYLKGGLAYADALTTVSPSYAKEISTRYEFGFGLEGLLHHRRDRLKGILNGLDTDAWNPKTDPYLVSNYTHESVKKKRTCKSDLLKIAGLREGKSTPLLGFVGRLDRQKGVSFLLEIAPSLLEQNVQMIFLGVGDPDIQKGLMALQRSFRGKVFVETAFSEPMAHKIYAGCDIFLMPSLFEPCGLGQMIAMRYGALPVVTPTGGLADTVIPFRDKSIGRGFVAKDISGASVKEAILEALQEFKNTAAWARTQRRDMKIDFSWEKSLPAYIEHYEKALAWRKKAS